MTADPDLYLDLEAELEPQVLPEGAVIAERYSIVSVLGRGGMGVVYKAEHLHMERFVAMKMMLEQTSSASQDYRRFQREAKAASLLDHPNIVSIHDFGYADGQAYLCMDYLEGKSLDQVLEKAPLTLDQFRHIFAQACDALQHAHEKGMVHRDLKPSNMMVIERRGDKNFVVVLDFGLVKMVDGNSDHKLTATNMVLGSPLYMSPEQCRAVELDQRSDIYSLGCVMYEALTGVPPLTADTVFDVMNKHISTTPMPIREASPGAYVPPALERIIFQAMAKSPEHRPKSMAELAKGIESSFSGAPDLALAKTKTLKSADEKGLEGKGKQSSRPKVILTSIGIWLGVLLLVSSGMWFEELVHPSKQSKSRTPPVAAPSEPGTTASSASQPVATGDSIHGSSSNHPSASLTPAGQTKEVSAPNGGLSALPLTGQKGSTSSNQTTLPNAGPSSVPLKPFPVSSATSTPLSSSPDMAISSSRTSQSNESSQTKAPSIEQVKAEANISFSNGQYREAHRKLDELLSMTSSYDVQTPALAKLVICAYSEGDYKACAEYLNKFTEQFSFNSRSMENDTNLLCGPSGIFAISKQLSSNSETEKLAQASLEVLSGLSSHPNVNSIRLKLDMNRFYRESGRNSEGEAILQSALNDAEQMGDQNQVSLVKGVMQMRPPGGGFGGPGGSGPQGGGPQGGGPPGGGYGGGPGAEGGAGGFAGGPGGAGGGGFGGGPGGGGGGFGGGPGGGGGGFGGPGPRGGQQ